MVGGAPHAHDQPFLRRRAYHQRLPERPRPCRRLHERGQLPRHRGPRVALRLRRPHLFDRLARRLARGPVPDRGAAAQPGQVHLRRRGRLPHAATAGADLRRHRHPGHGDLLPHRADGGSGQPHPADVRPALRGGGGGGRCRDAGVRPVRRDDRHHVGPDREGGAVAERRLHLDAARPLPLRLQPGGALLGGGRPLRRGRAHPRPARVQPVGRGVAGARPDVRHRGPAAHPDAVLHGARRARGAGLGLLRHRLHRLLLPAHVRPRLRGHGDRGPGRDPGRRPRREHGRAAARRGRGRHRVPRLHRRRSLRHHPRGRRRLDALRRSGPFPRPVGQRRPARGGGGAGAAPRRAAGRGRPGRAGHRPRHHLQGPERGLHGRPGVRDSRDHLFHGSSHTRVAALGDWSAD